jgi:PHS family inorganic phosphate transporter-like MFS transporter
MSDAYDLFCIGMLTKLIGRIYYTAPLCTYATATSLWTCKISGPGTLNTDINGAVTSVALVGTLCGQLLWGRIGDLIGRKIVYGLTLIVMIIAAIGSGEKRTADNT